MTNKNKNMIFSENRLVYFEAPKSVVEQQSVLPNPLPKKENPAELVVSGNASLDRVEGLNDTEQAKPMEKLKQHLAQYLKTAWSVENPDISRIKFLEVKDFPPQYKQQFDFIKDPQISNAVIASIPANMWKKSQPTESDAEKGLILIREDYFAGEDKVSWGSHELGHLLKHATNPKAYNGDYEKPAFKDIPGPYPNNQVELVAFTKQFQFLKEQGVKREEVIPMLIKEDPDYETIPGAKEFFQKVMDEMSY